MLKKRTHILKNLLAPIAILWIIAAILITQDIKAQNKIFSINTEASCITSACHADMGKKQHTHEPARNGEGCTICHEVLKKGEHGFKLQMSLPDLCYQCHENKADKKFKHMPVEEGMCLSCHLPHESDNMRLLIMPAIDVQCFTCHDEKDFKGSAPHTPVSEGRCLDCHGPHSTDNPKQLVKPVPDLCFECHNRDLKDTKGITLPSTKDTYTGKGMILHKPFAQGKCIDCHYPHPVNTHRLLKGSYPEGFYTSYSEDSYSLCFKCHQGIKNALKAPRTLTDTGFRNGNLNLHYRHVNRAKGRACKTCHQHHGSKNPKLIRDTFPFGSRSLTIKYEKTETGGSCAPACHAAVQYDRYEPREITMKTTPREGRDAIPDELRLNREKEAQEIKREGDKK